MYKFSSREAPAGHMQYIPRVVAGGRRGRGRGYEYGVHTEERRGCTGAHDKEGKEQQRLG